MKPTTEQIEAVRLFAAANGRKWKGELRNLWMNGAYNNAVMGGADSALLQQLRNSFGPSWLNSFRLPDPQCRMADFPKDRKPKLTLKTMELTNGEFAKVCEFVDFLQWMKTQSACIPERFDGEECDHLMTRYMLHVRREQMQYVNQLRIQRGESTLPASLFR